MPVQTKDFGKANVNGSEGTYFLPHATLYWVPGTVITEKEILPVSTLDKQYQSGSWQEYANSQQNIITGMRALPNIQFAAVSSEDDQSTLMYFLAHSFIELQANNKVYDKIALNHIVPFDIYYNGGYVAQPKQQDWFRFHDPIKIPDGNFKMTFKPASNLTLASSGASNPQLYNLGLTSNYAFWMKIYFAGAANRDIA